MGYFMGKVCLSMRGPPLTQDNGKAIFNMDSGFKNGKISQLTKDSILKE